MSLTALPARVFRGSEFFTGTTVTLGNLPMTLEEVVEVAAVLAHALPPYTPFAADTPLRLGADPD